MRQMSLIVNARSGSHDPDLVNRITDAANTHGWKIAQVIDVCEMELPDLASLQKDGIDWVVSHTGDGTLNSLAKQLEGWQGAVLVLPGGTMNFVAKQLHGEATADEILERALDGDARLRRLPVVQLGDMVSFCGVIAGPTAAWSDVREALRERDVTAFIENAQSALRETQHGERPIVRDASSEVIEDDAPSLFVEPHEDGLQVTSFSAENFTDLAKHGLAWIARDFRNGPNEYLGIEQLVEVHAPVSGVGLLVDGEKTEGGKVVRMTPGVFDLQFVATK